uniref:GNAT family N-acetyltransferase n=1 Tax=Chrysotila carterae TaxID=13221 RepID=A0A7S4C1F6_CHRCT
MPASRLPVVLLAFVVAHARAIRSGCAIGRRLCSGSSLTGRPATHRITALLGGSFPTILRCDLFGAHSSTQGSHRRWRARTLDCSQKQMLVRHAEQGVALTLLTSVHGVSRDQWDACAASADGVMENPFVAWDYLAALETSGSVHAREGWSPRHLIALNETSGELIGCVPLYLKSHSRGEYVFDHAWARAYRSLSSCGALEGYYPKLQGCVPFTPVTGPRLLVSGATSLGTAERLARKRLLARALKRLPEQLGVSGVHITFSEREEWLLLAEEGFERRLGLQYHWQNRAGWRCFEDYLADLKQGRRKAIRQERKKVANAGVVVRRLRGKQIEQRHWDAFYQFYLNTVEEKWGQAYLKRSFFDEISGSDLGESVMLIVAELADTGELVAGALNFIGADCIFGRNWGCSQQFDSLHFELCYYQAIEAALELGLTSVEAGAQGDHKIRRGYLPRLTYSAHYMKDSGFTTAVGQFLEAEREQTYLTLSMLCMQESPFKEDPTEYLAEQGVALQGDTLVVEES